MIPPPGERGGRTQQNPYLLLQQFLQRLLMERWNDDRDESSDITIILMKLPSKDELGQLLAGQYPRLARDIVKTLRPLMNTSRPESCRNVCKNCGDNPLFAKIRMAVPQELAVRTKTPLLTSRWCSSRTRCVKKAHGALRHPLCAAMRANRMRADEGAKPGGANGMV